MRVLTGSRAGRVLLGGVLGCAAVLAGGLAGYADRLQTPQQRPTFRAGAHFVRVDAYPVRNGRIIRDLTAGDFELLEDGRPQAIETLEFVEFQAWTPEAERRDPNSVQEGFRLAADPRYRVFVIYYDVHHVSFYGAERLRLPLTNMIERMLGPRDLVGFLTPRQEPDDLTLGQRTFGIQRSLDRILEANTVGADLLDREETLLFTCYPWLSEDQIKAVIRTRRLEKVYRDLSALVARLGALREERKNIVVLSSDLTGPPLRVPDQSVPRRPTVGTEPGTGRLGIDSRTNPMAGDRRWCDEELGRLRLFDPTRERRDLVVAARAANVAIYTVSPAGLGGENVGERGYDLMADHTVSLLEISEGTDALAVLSTNDLDAGLGRIVEDVSAYYTLGYYTANTKWDGGLRRIEVRLRSSGAPVRARREYRAPTSTEMAAASAAFERAPAGGPGPVEAALDSLSRIGPRTPLFARGVHDGRALVIAVELPSSAAGASSAGAVVRAEATSRDSGAAGSADGRIDAGMRGALVSIPVAGTGPWHVAVEVTSRGGSITERLEIRPAGQEPLGVPLIFRATPSPRSPLLPAAEPMFRRTERLHLEWRPTTRPDRPEARLLNTRGEPLSVPVVLTTREGEGGIVLVADVVLTPLAPGNYVVELRGTSNAREAQSLFAFRVTQ